MRDDARRFENWENNIAAVLGLGAAVDYLLAIGTEEASDRLCMLADTARRKLSEIPAVTVHDIGTHKGGMVTFSHANLDPSQIKEKLASASINVSTSSISSTRYDMERRNLGTIVRASFHYYNTEDEVDRLIAEVAKF
jgi:selenocysteine lyase/cysteine desulfurase